MGYFSVICDGGGRDGAEPWSARDQVIDDPCDEGLPRFALMGSSEPDPPDDDAKPQSASEEEGHDGSHSAVRVLMLRSRLAQAMKDVPRYNNILVIEDDVRDSERLASTLRAVFGYDVKLRQCRTLGTALDAVLSDAPDLVFLDDRMGPVDRAEKSVPFLRTAKCDALIIVVSGHFDRRRRAQVLALGVGEVIDKDDLDSTSICQALVDAHKTKR